MKKPPFTSALVLFSFLINLFPGIVNGQSSNSKCGLSKEYSILAAQLADQSHLFSKLAYSVNNKELAKANIDTAVSFLEQSIISIDSAIFFANDSNILGLNYANIAKKEALKAHQKLKMYEQYADAGSKYTLAKDATFLSANTTVDAYHASFYFTDCIPKEKKEEKKQPENITAKDIEKIDVDQTLFTLLDRFLSEKNEANQKEILSLLEKMKNEKDPAKIAKLKAQIEKLQQQENDIANKDKEARSKLEDINSKIDERNKSGRNKEADPVFSKTISKPLYQWNKGFIMDSGIPTGLVYQVQIGLYKNEIKPAVFKGLTPIFGKTVPGGITYSSGLFEKYTDAIQAMDYIKSIGLTDAFVIAYYNQKKITLAEAKKLETK